MRNESRRKKTRICPARQAFIMATRKPGEIMALAREEATTRRCDKYRDNICAYDENTYDY